MGFVVSFSSSLSPRLKGSCSPRGDGSTDDNGCHLLCLPPEDGAGAGLAGLDAPAEAPISVGGPSWNDTFLLTGEGDDDLWRSELARGRGGRGGGAMASQQLNKGIIKERREPDLQNLLAQE